MTTGIVIALAELSARPEVAAEAIDAVVIGTTHFVNAVVQRRGLARVAAVRIGLPAAASLPPFCDWPPDLARLVRGEVFMLEGGHDYDGRPIVPFDEDGMRRAARQIRDSGIRSVAVAAIFSPLDPSHEERAAEILRQECPEAAITLSRDLGRIGLLERENAALLNAALIPLARTTIAGFTAAIAASGITAPLYLTQNDGTVMTEAVAAALPVVSFASGATNSMRGAAYLSGLAEAIVVDVGGTSTDVGQLRRGFPREANSVVEVGGVRTLFRMPDLLSIGLGGGSLVARDPLRVGPHSLGYRLTREALVFGGNTLTATDAAVAAGVADIGNAGAVAHLPAGLVRAVLDARARQDRGRGRPDQDRSRRAAVDRGRRRRIPDPRPSRRDLAGGSGRAWRVRQRGRCRNRAGERRDRSDLSRPRPQRGDHRGRSAGEGPRGRRRSRQRQPRGGRCRRHAARLSAGQRAQGAGQGGRRDAREADGLTPIAAGRSAAC